MLWAWLDPVHANTLQDMNIFEPRGGRKMAGEEYADRFVGHTFDFGPQVVISSAPRILPDRNGSDA